MMAPAPIDASSTVKTPAPLIKPMPSKRLAVSGSRAMMAVDIKKNATVRAITARMRGDSLMNCRPTRMALGRRSRPSGLVVGGVRCQRSKIRPATTDSNAFSTNTQSVPALAITAPATSGPTMREAFMATPLSAMADGSSGLLTTSGIKAENTGQRMAMPMPLANVSASSNGALIRSKAKAAHSSSATAATQNCVKMK